MLPIKPKSQLIVSTSEPTAFHKNKALMKESLRQFSRKASRLMIQNPFWALVIGSLGLHTAFALLTPNPLKKTEAPPPEVIVPTVKLPPKAVQLTNIPKPNKSLFDDLFVKPLNKLDASKTLASNSADLNLFDRVENFPLTDNNFAVEDFQSFDKTTTTSEPPKNQDPKPKVQTTPPSRFTETGKIDNTTPNKTIATNIKPELQGNGLKNDPNPKPDNKNDGARKTAQNVSGKSSSPSKSIFPEQQFNDFTTFIFTDPDILEYRTKGKLIQTEIRPDGLLISLPDEKIEKGVKWIPLKTTKVAGKSGTVTYGWLLKPNGDIIKRLIPKDADPELLKIVKETVTGYERDFKLKPLDDPKNSEKVRLVSVKYDF